MIQHQSGGPVDVVGGALLSNETELFIGSCLAAGNQFPATTFCQQIPHLVIELEYLRHADICNPAQFQLTFNHSPADRFDSFRLREKVRVMNFDQPGAEFTR